MIADDTQEELSMEEILSSIKDILDEGMQPKDNAEKPQEQAVAEIPAVAVEGKTPNVEPVFEENISQPSVPEINFPSNDMSELPDIDDDEDILDLSAAMIIPEKAAENVETFSSVEDIVEEISEKEESVSPAISGLDDIDIADLKLPDLSDIQVPPTVAVSNVAENPLDELAQSPFYQQEQKTEEATPVQETAEETRGLLSDLLKNDLPDEEAFATEVSADSEPSDLRVAESISEYTVDEEAEPFYPETEEIGLPVIEPDVEQIVNQDILEDYKTKDADLNEQPELPTDTIETPAPDGNEVNDVSAGIINSFAKMFSHEDVDVPVSQHKKDYSQVESIGNGALTIEDIVESVIYDVVSSKVDAALHNNAAIESFAKNEIARQTQIWLTTQMPALIEAFVKKEMERVMAKVGK